VQSQQRAAKGLGRRPFRALGDPGKDVNGMTILAKDEHMRPTDHHAVVGAAAALLRADGRSSGGFDAVAVQAHPEVEFVEHVHHAGNSSGIVDGAAAVLIGSREAGRSAKAQAARPGSRPSPILVPSPR